MISMKEFKALAQLLDKGYPMKDTLLLINPKFKTLLMQLDKGIPFEELAIYPFHGAFYEHCRFFLTISALPTAILSSLSLIEFKKSIINKWIKETAYPIFVFSFAFIILFIFSGFILPTMMNSFSGIGMNQSVFILINFLKILAIILLFSIFLLILLVLLFMFNKVIQLSLFNYFLKYLSITKEIISYFLATYMVELSVRGCSTKEMIHCLLKMKHQPVMKMIVDDLSIRLESGEDLSKLIADYPLFQSQFKFFFTIGNHTQTMSSALYDYLSYQEDTWVKHIKVASMFIQVFAYSFIGVIVLAIYQMMLLPLELLNTF